MKSRYDFMAASEVLDTDGTEFPDILSVDYSKIQFNGDLPVPSIISAGDVEKFWIYMYKNYGITYFDDLLLNVNGIPYVGMLQPGEKILNVSMEDLNNFNKNIIPEFKYE